MKHIGLFIDVDNAQLAAADLALIHCRSSTLWVGALIAELERVSRGVVSVRRAYGDVLLNAGYALRNNTWKIKELREQIGMDVEFQMDLVNNGFQMIHCPTVSRKNRADILMALDCMELAGSAEHIDAFAVVSQDSDFSALLHRLRALGKEVILITVGRPTGQGWRALEALASEWVVYDQGVIDRAGFEPFKAIVDELKQTERASLELGIALSAVHARLLQNQPTFAYEAVGFQRFSEFVDACVEHPLIRKNNELRLTEPPPLAHPEELPDAGPLPREDVVPPVSRDHQLLAALRKQQLRPLPELRREMGRWLREKIFVESGTPLNPLTYADPVSLLEDRFCHAGHSKSQVGDALRVLSMSGIIALDRSGGVSIRMSPVLSLLSQDTSRAKIVSFLAQRLQAAGEILSETDIPPLARVVFGAADEELQTVTRQGIELAKDREGDEVTRSPVQIPPIEFTPTLEQWARTRDHGS